MENAKELLASEKSIIHTKYVELGLIDYAGLVDATTMDARQTRLHAAMNAEYRAIEDRYKISAGR